MPTKSTRGRAGWRAHLAGWFTERLVLKATAVLLAVMLWFIVSAKEPTEDLVAVKFAPELDSALVLRDPPPPIRALVLGTSRELLKLYSSPPVIKRPIAADSPDTLVLDLHSNDVEVPSGIDAVVEDVRPRSVTLRFETSSTRRVPVRSSIQVDGPPGSPPIQVRLDPESVDVSGPRREVRRLRFVRTVRAMLPASDSLPHLEDIDTAGLAVRVKPPQVKVYILPPAGSPPAPGASESPARQHGDESTQRGTAHISNSVPRRPLK